MIICGVALATGFNQKGFGQEIDKFYNGDEITLDDIARFLHSVRDLTCNQNCNVPLVKVGQTRTFTVERDRFWDNEEAQTTASS